MLTAHALLCAHTHTHLDDLYVYTSLDGEKARRRLAETQVATVRHSSSRSESI